RPHNDWSLVGNRQTEQTPGAGRRPWLGKRPCSSPGRPVSGGENTKPPGAAFATRVAHATVRCVAARLSRPEIADHHGHEPPDTNFSLDWFSTPSRPERGDVARIAVALPMRRGRSAQDRGGVMCQDMGLARTLV